MRTALTACGLALAAMISPASALTLNASTGTPMVQPEQVQNGLSNATVIIVRHAEKTGYGKGLSAAGDVRAMAYVNYFKTFALNGEPMRINALVAAEDTKRSARPRLTLEPLSQQMGMNIHQPCTETAVHQLVDWLRARPAERTTLIAWHHTKIPMLLTAFGVNPENVLPKGHWPNDVFDWVVVLRFDSQGKLIPGATRMVQEPSSIDNVVWKAMSHPTIQPLGKFLQQASAQDSSTGDEVASR